MDARRVVRRRTQAPHFVKTYDFNLTVWGDPASSLGLSPSVRLAPSGERGGGANEYVRRAARCPPPPPRFVSSSSPVQ
jgi:hypothetical protein